MAADAPRPAAAGRLLVVDDDATVLVSLAEALAEEGFDVATAGDGAAALEVLARERPDVVLSDVRMPELDGIALLRLVRERAPGTDVVLMTAFDDMPTVVTAMREGAAEFLVKPLELDGLLGVLRRVLDDRLVRRQLGRRARPAARLDDIVGHDPAMIAIYKRIGQAAASRANVLVRGESGTGKELVARALHQHSAGAREPFIAVNCAALPSTLLESELFGHVRGAYTGAVQARRGAFALAGAGTIFLDEIGDTSPEFQSKLLRVLQSREYQPLGAERLERTEARVVAATHQDLEALIARGRFRADLYYRLRVVEITVPPLRERPEDVALLAHHFVQRASESLGCPEPVLSRAALHVLERHPWPGNVRELEHAITRAVVLSGGGVVRPEHVALGDGRPADAGAGTAAPVQSLAANEREHVARVLASVQGNKTRAAELLGVSRPRLNRLLQKHRLD